MNFSECWRSVFPVSGVFAAPKLLCSHADSPQFGALDFSPAAPPSTLLTLPPYPFSFPSQPPPSLHPLHGLLSSNAVGHSLISSSAAPPIPSNLATMLRVPSSSRVIVFFPQGPCANFVAFAEVRNCEVVGIGDGSGSVGEVYVQRDGFCESHHRILRLSAVACCRQDGVTVGYLVASTLYSVSWFRVEMHSEGGKKADSVYMRPFLVPVAKRRFEQVVVDACISPHFQEESAVLLERGEVCWFNLVNMRSGKMRVCHIRVTSVEEQTRCGWLGCTYGAQPWILLVANSQEVVLVDLRQGEGQKYVLLAKIGAMRMYDTNISVPKDSNRILAFCKAKYDNFLIALVTNDKLILLDVRQPLMPLLIWDHGLESPNHIAMFRLAELRPSKKFTWSSESRFAILVGSFWHNEFSLFFYGPKKTGLSMTSPLYAWEIPLSLHLSGLSSESGDLVLNEALVVDNADNSVQIKMKNLVVGYCILPSDLQSIEATSDGFILLRFMSHGRLELQKYSVCSHDMKSQDKVKLLSIENDLVPFLHDFADQNLVRCYFLKLHLFCKYLNGTLSNALTSCGLHLYDGGMSTLTPHSSVRDLVKELHLSSSSTNAFINDVSTPTSVFEIAFRSAFNLLPANVLCLAFAKYSDIYGDDRKKNFELLAVPSCLSHHRFRTFLVAGSSSIGEKWRRKSLQGDDVVGPVLPVPFLLALDCHQTYDDDAASLSKEETENLFDRQCEEVVENLFSESIANREKCDGWDDSSHVVDDEKCLFVYETHACRSSLSCGKPTERVEEAFDCGELCRNYTTFVSGALTQSDYSKEEAYTQGSPSLQAYPEVSTDFISDICPIKLDFEPSSNVMQSNEKNALRSLKRQASNWLRNFEPYQEFCALSKKAKLR